MCVMILERKAPTESCPHAEMETLGNDADAEFARCHACGQVVVFQGGRTWAIPPDPRPGDLDPLIPRRHGDRPGRTFKGRR